MSDLSMRFHRLATMDPLEEINSAPVKKKPQEKREKVKRELSTLEFINELNGELDDISDGLGLSYSFDDCIDGLGDNDEDLNLKSSLLSMGKKYNREHIIDDSDTRNAIDKAFGPQERKLQELADGLERDVKEIDQFLYDIKASRTRNSKVLADLFNARNTTKGQYLSTIKELNSVQKTKFDIASKQKKEEADSSDAVTSANIAVQQLLATGRESLLESVGGRERTSGALLDDDDPYSLIEDSFSMDNTMDDDEDDTFDELEGDRFIKYENIYDHLELEVRSDGSYGKVKAIDKDGNWIPDYPVPDDVSDLRFKVDHSSNIASDQLNRRFHLVYEDERDELDIM